jgi:hypothetical protein
MDGKYNAPVNQIKVGRGWYTGARLWRDFEGLPATRGHQKDTGNQCQQAEVSQPHFYSKDMQWKD